MLILICYITLLVAFYVSVTTFCTPTGWYAYLSQGNFIYNLCLLRILLAFIWAYPHNAMHETELLELL
jgi:hypothetical protein